MRRTFALAAMIAIGGGLTISADNWPQWRGPHLDGTSRETGLPTKWSQTENIAWKTALPMRSGATPIVWRDHLFLNVAEGGELFLWALDRLLRGVWPGGRVRHYANLRQVWDEGQRGNIPAQERGVRMEVHPDDGSKEWTDLYARAEQAPVHDRR